MRNIFIFLLTLTTITSAQVMSFIKPATGINPKTGLVAFWKFEETATPYSEYTGAYALTASSTPGTATGKIGKAVDLEWSTEWQYLFRSGVSDLTFNNVTFTLSCWVKFESIESTYFVGLMTRYDTGGGKREYGLFCDNTWKCLDFRVSPDGVNSVAARTPNESVTTGVWYNVVGWYNATTDSAYIAINDGTIYRTYGATGAKPAANDFCIGMNVTSTNNRLDGLIDCAGVWNTCPQASDGYAMLTSLYNGGNGWEPN